MELFQNKLMKISQTSTLSKPVQDKLQNGQNIFGNAIKSAPLTPNTILSKLQPNNPPLLIRCLWEEVKSSEKDKI